jgi:hypothetical protein
MRWARWGVGIPAVCVAALAWGQAAQIYSCVDSNGKKLTSDRPIPECNSKEQRVLNSDGSVKRVVPPTPTADEITELEKRERDAAAERAAHQDAIHRDRNLLARYPNEAAHNKARQAALEDNRKAVHLIEARLVDLANERKPLMDESEFYVGKPLPGKLKMQIDANDASFDAQRSLLQNRRDEITRINQFYDAELSRLRSLWAGAQPGSMGMLPGAASAPRR